jgi:hypothetical protein
MIWPIVLPSIEFGMWLGSLTGRIGSRDRVRGYLIDGTKAARSMTFLDNRMEWQTRNASKRDRRLAAGVARGARFLVGTRAFELATLKMISDGRKQLFDRPQEVKLHL